MNVCLVLAAMGVGIGANAQTTLDECISLAFENYPQVQEMSLIEKTKDLDLKNAAFAWIPQLNVSGKATWQSQVVETLPSRFGMAVQATVRRNLPKQEPR